MDFFKMLGNLFSSWEAYVIIFVLLVCIPLIFIVSSTDRKPIKLPKKKPMNVRQVTPRPAEDEGDDEEDDDEE